MCRYYHKGSIKKAVDNWRAGRPPDKVYVDLLYIMGKGYPRLTENNELVSCFVSYFSDEC